MPLSDQPIVSIVIATHNRRDVLTATLSRLGNGGLERDEVEVIVVDNASTDGTARSAARHADRVVRLSGNEGSCAKAYGVEQASGKYILFLDDDSYPQAGAVTRMVTHFEHDPGLGAAGFVVHLPDGREEGSALTDVFLGCGVGFRAEALRSAGGLDRSFFMQAEEYDLAFRLVGAGWSVRLFDDLHVDHLKSPDARQTERTTFYDICNNLRVVSRYLSGPYYTVYRRDWEQRYGWLARRHGHGRAFRRGLRAGRWRGRIERWSHRRRRLSPDALEHFFRWVFVRRKMAALAQKGVQRVVFADLGKNVYAFFRAAKEVGVSIQAIGDDRFAQPRRCYRGVVVMPLVQALQQPCDAVVVSNTAVVFAAETDRRVRAQSDRPVHTWFRRQPEPRAIRQSCLSLPKTADDKERTRACSAAG